MFPIPKQILSLISKKINSLTGLVEKIIIFTLAGSLSLMFFLNGGLDFGKHALLVPLFGILILLHGIFVYLRCRSKRREGDYFLNASPLKFLPFLFWAIFSVNFLSPIPWLGQIYLIYFFEAFIVFWIMANHIDKLKQLNIVLIALSLPFALHLYFGYSHFFHEKNLSELGIEKVISGLFFDSNSYAFITSIIIAGLAPAIFFRYWEKVKRAILFFIFLLTVLGLVMANNFQGFLMLSLALICSGYFALYKIASQIKFLLTALVFVCITYLVFHFSFKEYSDYFYSAFNTDDSSYFFSAWIASFFLFIKNCILGVGLGGFEAKLNTVKSFNFPLTISNPSNFYLLILCEFGIIGSLLMAKPLLSLIKEKYKHLKTIPKWEIVDRRRCVPLERLLLSIFLSMVITFALVSLFHSVIILPFFICFFAVILAVLNFKINAKSPEIIENNVARTEIFAVRKDSKDARYYLCFACALSALFSFDGYKVFMAQEHYENAGADFQAILESPANFNDQDLIEVLIVANDSIKENKYNLDAWLLKHEILNTLYNKNSIRYENYPDLMLEASQFVLDRKKNYWKAWMRHGISLTLVEEFKEAEYAFTRSLKLAPNNFETNFYMASYLIHFKERFEEARKYIEKVLAIAPANPEALAMNQKLNL
jgi:hypothetical protein